MIRLWALLGSFLVAGELAAAPDIADVHVHYKWTQAEVTSKQQAIRILRDNNVSLAVVIGTPDRYALELQQLAPELIIPVWSPYRSRADRVRWVFDASVLERAERALAGGHYKGIGELHLVAGFTPDWRTPVISGLLALAARHNVPLLLHTEFSRADYLTAMCGAFPATKIVWAHAGAVLEPGAVREVMTACPNIRTELSARDPWRFVRHPIADEQGRLLPDWRKLVEEFPDRFMIGSDPVWPVEQMDSWDEPDSGWEHYGRFMGFHLKWLEDIDPAIAERIRFGNARALFGKRK